MLQPRTYPAFYVVICSLMKPTCSKDEIFHIPQAQKYCQGKFFEWDGKITTPPGLYERFPLVHIRPLATSGLLTFRLAVDTSSLSQCTVSPLR